MRIVLIVLFTCMAGWSQAPLSPTFAALRESLSACRGLNTGIRVEVRIDGVWRCPIVGSAKYDQAADTIWLGGTSGTLTFITNTAPEGAIDGVNATFRLKPAPSNNILIGAFRNGAILKPTAEYVVSGDSVTFVGSAVPQPGDTLTFLYQVLPNP